MFGIETGGMAGDADGRELADGPVGRPGKKGCSESAGSSFAPRRGSIPRVVAYISDFTATRGAVVLFEQKAAVDACAAALEISRYYCDSGALDDPGSCGAGLALLLRHASEGRFDAVAVEDIRRFAPNVATVLWVVIELLGIGIEIHEATSPLLKLQSQADGGARPRKAGRRTRRP